MLSAGILTKIPAGRTARIGIFAGSLYARVRWSVKLFRLRH
jgi:hypothetical protein